MDINTDALKKVLPSIIKPKRLMGRVVNRDDPEMNDRCQVRVVGLHPEGTAQGGTQGISNEDLPWYPMARAAGQGAISGTGSSGGGITEGTLVIVEFFDDWYRMGYITQELPSSPEVLAAYNVGQGGFSDPYGTYPSRAGVSTSATTSLDLGADDTSSNRTRKANAEVSVDPSKLPQEELLDDKPAYSLAEMLKSDEGAKTKVYWDTLGYPTVGIGHLIVHQKTKDIALINQLLSKQISREITTTGLPATITDDEMLTLFNNDLSLKATAVERLPLIAAAITAAGDNRPRKWAIMNMAFQMGEGGLNKFTTSLGLCAAGKWKEAGEAFKQSRWYKQTPKRASRVIYTLQYGNMRIYGVEPGTGRSRIVLDESQLNRSLAFSAVSAIEPRICFDPIKEIKEKSIEYIKRFYEYFLKLTKVAKAYYDDLVENFEDMMTTLMNKIKGGIDYIQKKIEEVQKWLLAQFEDWTKSATEYAKLLEDKANAWLEEFEAKAKKKVKEWTKPLLDDSCDTKSKTKSSRATASYAPWDDYEPSTDTLDWAEPEPKGTPQYQNTFSRVTRSGHTEELDDTPGNTRMFWMQGTSGSYEEWNDSYSTRKTFGDDYTIVTGDRYFMSQGNEIRTNSGNLTQGVGADHIMTVNGNRNIHTRVNENITTDGNVIQLVHGDVTVTIDKNKKVTVLGNTEVDIKGTCVINIVGDVTLNAEANVNANVKGNMTQTVDGNWDVHAKGNINMIADGITSIDGSRINLG